MKDFFVRIEAGGKFTAGPMDDGQIYSGIGEESRFWPSISGWINSGGEIQEASIPAVDSPPQLTARQFWLAAYDAGVTKESLISMIRGSYPEAEAGRIVLELEVSTHFSRDYPLMNELYPLMSISEVEFETLWQWASKI